MYKIIFICPCLWLFIFSNINLKSTTNTHYVIFIWSHVWNFIIFIFYDLNLIVQTIKKKWLTWYNLFKTWVTMWIFFTCCIFPFVWTVESNYWVKICLQQSNCLLVVFTFSPKSFWTFSISAGFVNKFCFFIFFKFFKLVV